MLPEFLIDGFKLMNPFSLIVCLRPRISRFWIILPGIVIATRIAVRVARVTPVSPVGFGLYSWIAIQPLCSPGLVFSGTSIRKLTVL